MFGVQKLDIQSFVQLDMDGNEKAPQSVHFACANVCLFYLM